jgi:hypothetical protein
MNLPPFIGGLLGTVYSVVTLDHSTVYFANCNNGIFEPEMRL